MRKIQPKTLTPLLMLRILEEYSDENHPLTREEIERILDEEYGITMERKAFFRHMKSLGAREEDDLHLYDERIADIRRVVIEPKDPDKKPCAGFYLTDRLAKAFTRASNHGAPLVQAGTVYFPLFP